MAISSLTHAMLDDLHIGNASLSLLAYDAAGVNIATMDFSAGGHIFTLEDTFNLSADDPSSSDIRIDQHREVIDVAIDKGGNWVMTGNIPSQAQAVFDEFYEAGIASAVTGGEGDSYTGKGYQATPNVVEVSVLAESESKNTAILFPHVKMVLSRPKKDDNSNPLYMTFTGFILPNPYISGTGSSAKPAGDFVVLKKSTTGNG